MLFLKSKHFEKEFVMTQSLPKWINSNNHEVTKIHVLLLFYIAKFPDERDAIQKKTFTKWVNKHLKKVIIE